MLRDVNQRDGISVPPTMAARPTPEVPGHRESARLSDQDTASGGDREATAGQSETPDPGETTTRQSGEPNPARTRRQADVADGGAAAWRAGRFRTAPAVAQDRPDRRYLLAPERAYTQRLEQELTTRQNDQTLVAQERARIRDLEQQLAARQNDQEALAQERARIKSLEQQLAECQKDQEALARERARSNALEQQLAARQSDQPLVAQAHARIKDLERQLARLPRCGWRMADFEDSLPTDLRWFMHATEIATAIEEDFDLEDLKYVESAWQIVDADFRSFGWVVAMVDDRRLYLEYTIDHTEQDGREDLNVTSLPGGSFPKLDNTAARRWYKPDHINEHLGLAEPRSDRSLLRN
jgi:hypothetical protein